MKDVILTSICIVTIQLFDSYLRWLAFSRELSCEQTFKIWKKISAWSLIAGSIFLLRDVLTKN